MTEQKKRRPKDHERRSLQLDELKFLLVLVCAQDWQKLPERLAPIWFEPGGQDQYCTDTPLRVILSSLQHASERVCRMSGSLFDRETIDVLWDIQAVSMIAAEYRADRIFELPLQPNTAAQCFWRVLGRLCSIALQDPKMREIEERLTFDHFVTTYGSPAT